MYYSEREDIVIQGQCQSMKKKERRCLLQVKFFMWLMEGTTEGSEEDQRKRTSSVGFSTEWGHKKDQTLEERKRKEIIDP